MFFISIKAIQRLLVVGWCAQCLTVAAQERSQVKLDYSLGYVVGECMLQKCHVFTGWLETDMPETGKPVLVRVQQTLYGPSIQSDTTQVPYSKDVPAKAPFAGPALAWRGVPLERGVLLTFVLTLELSPLHNPGEPLFIGFERHTTDLIGGLIEQVKRLDATPSSISEAMASLSVTPDPAIAGLLFVRLTKQVSPSQPDLSSQLLAMMLGNRSVPPELWMTIADKIVVHYDRLSDGSKAGIISEFRRLCLSRDPQIALAAFHGLKGIANFDRSVQLSDADAAKLRAAYFDLVRTKQALRSSTLESDLDIHFQ